MRWLGAALLLAGCDSLLGEKTTFCPATNAICPSGLVCAGDVTLCGTPDEVNACRGTAELGECSSGEAPHGYCTSAICTACDPNFSWCHYGGWSQMTYAGPDLYSIWPLAKNDIYVSGDPGAVYHYDGSKWDALPSEGGDKLKSLWASSASDLFAVDGGMAIRHFDGSSWTATTLTYLNAVWGSGPRDVYAVGKNGAVRHYDGSTWSTQNPGVGANLLGVWGTDATQVFIAGTFNIVKSSGAGTWTSSLQDPSADFVAIWGTSGTDMYAAANCELGTCTGAFVRHYNGSMWEPATIVPIAPTALLTDIWTAADGMPFVSVDDGTIFRLEGTTWVKQMLDNPNTLKAIRGTAPDDVYSVGTPGVIWHYEGM